MNYSPQNIFARVEEALGGLLALIIAVSVMVAAVLIGFEQSPDGILDAVWRYGMVAAICLLEFLLVCALYQAIGKRPYAPAVALSLPRLPLLLRLPVSAFWMVHLLFVCGFIWAAHSAFTTSSVPVRLMLSALAAGLSYLAFAYLLNAVATVKPDKKIILHLWSKRLWYAALISLIAILLPFTGFVRKAPPADRKNSQQNSETTVAQPAHDVSR
jgi:hypothetical protein